MHCNNIGTELPQLWSPTLWFSTVDKINSSVCKKVESFIAYFISESPVIESWAFSAQWKPTCLSCVPVVLSPSTEKDYFVQHTLSLNVSHLLFLSDVFGRKSNQSVWRKYHELFLSAIMESNCPRLPGKVIPLAFPCVVFHLNEKQERKIKVFTSSTAV